MTLSALEKLLVAYLGLPSVCGFTNLWNFLCCLVQESGMTIITADDLDEAAKKAVKALVKA